MSVLEITTVKWWQVYFAPGEGDPADVTRLASLQAIDDAITGCGLSATGTKPSDAATTSGAYYTAHPGYTGGGFVDSSGAPAYPSRTYSFTDALQSTTPITFDLTYVGGSSGNPCQYNLEVTCGTNVSPSVVMLPGGGNGTVPANSTYDASENVFVSGATNRICVAIGEGPDLYGNLVFNIERTKNADGTDSSEGCIFQWMYSGASYATPNKIGNMVIPASGTVAGFNLWYISPVNQASATLSHATAIGALPITPFNFRPYFYGMGLQLYYGSDVAAYSPITVPIYGANHTYLPLNQGRYVQHTNPLRPTSLMMRYE